MILWKILFLLWFFFFREYYKGSVLLEYGGLWQFLTIGENFIVV